MNNRKTFCSWSMKCFFPVFPCSMRTDVWRLNCGRWSNCFPTIFATDSTGSGTRTPIGKHRNWSRSNRRWSIKHEPFSGQRLLLDRGIFTLGHRRRITKDNVKTYSRQIAKITHNNPIIILTVVRDTAFSLERTFDFFEDYWTNPTFR